MKSATAPNSTTLVLTYQRPVSNVLSQVQQVPILPEHVWAKYATGDGKALQRFPNNAPAQVHAAAGVSFALDAGERFGLVGESGCGKTTTILALMGLLSPTASLAGEVLIDGQNILAGGEDSVRAYRWTDIAMVFQGAMNALNPVKKIGWQIAEPMAFHGIAHGAAARKRATGPRACWPDLGDP